MKRLYTISISIALLFAISALGQYFLGPEIRYRANFALHGVQPVVVYSEYAEVMEDNGMPVLFLDRKKDTVVIGLNVAEVGQEQAAILSAVIQNMGEKYGLTGIVIWLLNEPFENDWFVIFCTPGSCALAGKHITMNDESWQRLMVDTGWVRR